MLIARLIFLEQTLKTSSFSPARRFLTRHKTQKKVRAWAENESMTSLIAILIFYLASTWLELMESFELSPKRDSSLEFFSAFPSLSPLIARSASKSNYPSFHETSTQTSDDYSLKLLMHRHFFRSPTSNAGNRCTNDKSQTEIFSLSQLNPSNQSLEFHRLLMMYLIIKNW